jgi:hypothetical protein
MKNYRFLIINKDGSTKVYYCNGKNIEHAKARARLFLYAVGELATDKEVVK